MSPYNFDDKIVAVTDEEQHETTTVPSSTAIKSVHRFQKIDFLVGLETTTQVITKKSYNESNQASTIDAVVAVNTLRVAGQKIKTVNKLLLKAPTINPKSKLPRKPYTRKAPSKSSSSSSAPTQTKASSSLLSDPSKVTPPITSSSDPTQAKASSSLSSDPTQIQTTQTIIKQEQVEFNSCDMHNDFKNLSETQWLSTSHVDHYLQSLVNHHYENENEFGRSVIIWDIASVEGMERSYRPSMILNNNRDQIFVLVANSNHYVVLSNINFNQSIHFNEYEEYMDDDAPRLNWFMYDTLNDPKHAQFAARAMDKLFPDMLGYRVKMVKVQQQQGVNDCGLFACAYIDLLSNGLDPSQYTFDQISLRSSFRKFLDEDAFQQFTNIYNPCLVEFNEIEIDWGYKWEERFADLMEQFKANRNKKTESYIVL
jgi:hypothetical protein